MFKQEQVSLNKHCKYLFIESSETGLVILISSKFIGKISNSHTSELMPKR
jgi:hypothetical protein